MPPGVCIRTRRRQAEVSWFGALCADDCEFLGVPDTLHRSTFEHCSDIARRADELGYQNLLLSSSWSPGQDALGFAFSMAVLTRQIHQLVALRMGEVHPPMLARAIATLDHVSRGRLALNIISSDLPGVKQDNAERHARSAEVLQILQQCWTQEFVEFTGDFYNIAPLHTAAVRPYQQHGGPLQYFGGISPRAQDLCARFCDVFLMWPETSEQILETMRSLTKQAAAYGRVIDYGMRIHVIVRETESQARDAARRLVSKLDERQGVEIKGRSQDCQSAGVLRQDALRTQADKDGYIEEHIWSGIGRGRSGCGSAIVGNPDQVYEKLQRYMDMGMRTFILSGYPHLDECEQFARYVLPRMRTCRLNEVQGRLPSPATRQQLAIAAR
ncbi:MAG: LLM class flavin-dependent oxidoreductase [Verrucomicrobium sp.]